MERERALRLRMENEVDNFRSEKKKIEADIEMSLAIKQRFRKELEQTIDRLHFTIKKTVMIQFHLCNMRIISSNKQSTKRMLWCKLKLKR